MSAPDVTSAVMAADEDAAAGGGAASTWLACHGQAVDALTAAARLRHPDGGRVDFADFLASVLAAAAANVGGVDVLISGRPGSWEAAKVHELVTGTVGWDESELWRHRTEPVRVRVCVAELAELDYGLPGLDAAWDRVESAHYDLPEDQRDDDQLDADVAALEARYKAAYAAYGQAFTAAVQAKAGEKTDLAVPVLVEVDADPQAQWWRPAHRDWMRLTDDDDLALELASHARTAVPAPDLTGTGTGTGAGTGTDGDPAAGSAAEVSR